MRKKYCFAKATYPLFILQEKLRAHVDKWARVHDDTLLYSLKNKTTGVWTKKHITLTEAQRIVGELYGC